ncbi:MAG: hypothetical protein R3B99_00330 [Polyangiales bacterium]
MHTPAAARPRSTSSSTAPHGAAFLARAPTDGWGHRLFLRCPGRFDPDSVDVVSAGPSGSFFVDDNVH